MRGRDRGGNIAGGGQGASEEAGSTGSELKVFSFMKLYKNTKRQDFGEKPW